MNEKKKLTIAQKASILSIIIGGAYISWKAAKAIKTILQPLTDDEEESEE